MVGGGGGPPDQIIDLTNDIFGVIIHYAPTGNEPTYDVAYDRGPSAGPKVWNMTAPDGVIDLTNDILGVIQHHPAGALGYDVQFDRGPWTGPNSWNETQGPDGVIDLPNDILGVILQFQHSCQ